MNDSSRVVAKPRSVPPDQGQVGSLASTPRRLRWLARCVRAAGLSVESAA